MVTFRDFNGGIVRFSFLSNAFSMKPGHVLVICIYKDQWLLTNHKIRGLEFPGGKVEMGESLADAAKREVLEETGAIVNELSFIGEYEVTHQNLMFVKSVFFGRVHSINDQTNYFETKGPILIKGDINELRFGDQFSYIMKDDVIKKCICKISKSFTPLIV